LLAALTALVGPASSLRHGHLTLQSISFPRQTSGRFATRTEDADGSMERRRTPTQRQARVQQTRIVGAGPRESEREQQYNRAPFPSPFYAREHKHSPSPPTDTRSGYTLPSAAPPPQQHRLKVNSWLERPTRADPCRSLPKLSATGCR